MTIPIAHAGHVIADLAMYGGPLFVMLGALGVSSLKSKRKS